MRPRLPLHRNHRPQCRSRPIKANHSASCSTCGPTKLEDERVRRYAAHALGELRDEGAIKPLIAAAEEREILLRQAAYFKARLRQQYRGPLLQKLNECQNLIEILRAKFAEIEGFRSRAKINLFGPYGLCRCNPFVHCLLRDRARVIDEVRTTGAQAGVIGKAIYEGMFSVVQALARAAQGKL